MNQNVLINIKRTDNKLIIIKRKNFGRGSDKFKDITIKKSLRELQDYQI